MAALLIGIPTLASRSPSAIHDFPFPNWLGSGGTSVNGAAPTAEGPLIIG